MSDSSDFDDCDEDDDDDDGNDDLELSNELFDNSNDDDDDDARSLSSLDSASILSFVLRQSRNDNYNLHPSRVDAPLDHYPRYRRASDPNPVSAPPTDAPEPASLTRRLSLVPLPQGERRTMLAPTEHREQLASRGLHIYIFGDNHTMYWMQVVHFRRQFLMQHGDVGILDFGGGAQNVNARRERTVPWVVCDGLFCILWVPFLSLDLMEALLALDLPFDMAYWTMVASVLFAHLMPIILPMRRSIAFKRVTFRFRLLDNPFLVASVSYHEYRCFATLFAVGAAENLLRRAYEVTKAHTCLAFYTSLILGHYFGILDFNWTFKLGELFYLRVYS